MLRRSSQRLHRTAETTAQVAPLVARCGVFLLLVACGQRDERAPLAADGYDDGADQDPIPDMTDLIEDVEDGLACSETAIDLPFKRPTFYFLLDSSESMLETMPATGGKTRHWAARTAITEMLYAVGHRVNFGAAVFPEPGGSACAPGTEVFTTRSGERPNAAGVSPVVDALAFNLRKLSPTGATPVSATLRTLLPDLAALGDKTHLFLLTDGAPNCDLEESCPTNRCIANIEGFSFEDGTRCDEMLNCCDVTLFPHLCLDDDDASDELAELRAAGVSTYVIGIPGSEVYASVLDEMADAAGTARLDEDTRYYRVDDVEALADTLARLGSELSLDCNFELEQEPERSALVGVFADGAELPLDDPDGWEWTSDRSIVLLGSACEDWQGGEWDRVEIIEGCASQVR